MKADVRLTRLQLLRYENSNNRLLLDDAVIVFMIDVYCL